MLGCYVHRTLMTVCLHMKRIDMFSLASSYNGITKSYFTANLNIIDSVHRQPIEKNVTNIKITNIALVINNPKLNLTETTDLRLLHIVPK